MDMYGEKVTDIVAPVTDVVDDAVGVGESHWFVAIVNHNSEKSSAERLSKMGVVSYIPTQSMVRVWKNGRKTMVDRVVLPSHVFIHCTEAERKEIVKLQFINRFMTDRALSAANNGGNRIVRISDREISRLKFMLGQSDIPVDITPYTYCKGDKVRVIRGSLTGLEGTVVDLRSTKSELTVVLGKLGCATLSIDTVNLELADSRK